MSDGDALLAAVLANPDDRAGRLAYADWLQEQGDEVAACVVRAQSDHGLPFVARPVAAREVTPEELPKSYDWREVFGVGGGGNTDRLTDACPPGANVDTSPPNIEDVAEVVAAVNGENDGDEWVGVFRMKDGRFVVAAGSCDYTGWD